MTRLPLALALLFVSQAIGCRATAIHSSPTHAVWVTRFDYKSSDDVARVIDQCADLGFNTVMFQVRGNGTTFYPSQLEPWADELGGSDPGFDPLATAIDRAHAREVSIHAWINVIPSWRGDTPPTNPDQLYRKHPEWHWYDREGRRQPLVDNFYVSLNPCLPEVREYLVEIGREIMREYDVDGLHLDYVRMVDDLIPQEVDYPRDAVTVALYRDETGLAPDDDLARWQLWKGEQITKLVTALREMIDDERPSAWLSAAVGGMPEEATDRHQRESRRWAEESLVDAVFPMNYTADLTLFRRRTSAWREMGDSVQVVTGVNIPLDRTADTIENSLGDAIVKSPDFSVFAYSFLFATGPETAEEARARAIRRDLLRNYLTSPLSPPVASRLSPPVGGQLSPPFDSRLSPPVDSRLSLPLSPQTLPSGAP